MVLGVDGHRGARVPGGGRDPLQVLGRDPLAQRARPRLPPSLAEQQPDRGRLDRHLDRAALGQPLGRELAEQVHVLGGGRRRALRVGGVLAQVVQRHQQPLRSAAPAPPPPRPRSTRPPRSGPRWPAWRASAVTSVPDPLAGGSRQQCLAQHKLSSTSSRSRSPGATTAIAAARGGCGTRSRRSVTLTLAPASGETTTSCAAATPSASSVAPVSSRPLDQAEPDRPELEVPGGRPDEADLRCRRRSVSGAPCAGSRSTDPSRCRNTSRRGGWPEVVDPGDGLLAPVAALVQVHGGLDEPDLVRQRLVVGVQPGPRDAGRDPRRLEGPQPGDREGRRQLPAPRPARTIRSVPNGLAHDRGRPARLGKERARTGRQHALRSG